MSIDFWVDDVEYPPCNSVVYFPADQVDFPFRVTELEHAIIHLKPNPPSAILLLGRSGTGKSMCCLYRLWHAFMAYWEKATSAGDPLIPRSAVFLHKTRDVHGNAGVRNIFKMTV